MWSANLRNGETAASTPCFLYISTRRAERLSIPQYDVSQKKTIPPTHPLRGVGVDNTTREEDMGERRSTDSWTQLWLKMAAGHTADCVTQDSICRKTIGVANSSAQKQVPNAKVMPIGDGRYTMTLKSLKAIVVDFCTPEVALFAANFFASVFFSGFVNFLLICGHGPFMASLLSKEAQKLSWSLHMRQVLEIMASIQMSLSVNSLNSRSMTISRRFRCYGSISLFSESLYQQGTTNNY